MPFMGGVMLLTLENEDTPDSNWNMASAVRIRTPDRADPEHLARRLMAFAVSLKAEAK